MALAPVLTWPAVEGATRYRVRRDGATVATITARRFEDDGVADGDHAYRVIALDAAGNASAPSDPAAVAVDRTAPAAPQPVARLRT